MSTFVSPPHGDVVRSAPHDQKASTELSAATAAQDEPRVSASLSTAGRLQPHGRSAALWAPDAHSTPR